LTFEVLLDAKDDAPHLEQDAAPHGTEAFQLPSASFLDLNYVGGLDISFKEDGKGEEGVAVLAVLRFPDMHVSCTTISKTPA
jgi:deoxyinosine 3'endonuclease (endonuclease V)